MDEPIITTADVLKRARRLLERGWCQHQMASDAKGGMCAAGSSRAVAFCARGAIWTSAMALCSPEWHRAAEDAEAAMEPIVGGMVAWNNAPERTHEEVLQAFDRAAEGK